jgi:hypothetical protein
MSSTIGRRMFLVKSSAACMGGCLLFSGNEILAATRWQDAAMIDPEKLCYCGYSCPEDCKFLLATKQNDPVLKKEAFREWELEKRFGLQFDPDQIFCFTCKPGDQPEGVILTHCTVRECAISKGFHACIQCEAVEECDKELWKRYPEFHKEVVKMSKRYLASLKSG